MLGAVADQRWPENWYCDGHDRRRVNVAQAATIAGVHRNTIYNWMAAGKVEFVRTASGQIRIFADSLWLTRPKGR